MKADELEHLLADSQWLRRVATACVSQDADDLMQRLYVEAIAHPPEHWSSPRAWVATVLRRLVAKERRSSRRRHKRERAAAKPEQIDDSPAQRLVKLELLRSVATAVIALPEPSRSAVVMRYYEDLDIDEIARRQNVSPSAVRSQIARGVERLRRTLHAHDSTRRHALLTLALPASSAVSTTPSLFTLGGIAIMNKWLTGLVLVALIACGGLAHKLSHVLEDSRQFQSNFTLAEAEIAALKRERDSALSARDDALNQVARTTTPPKPKLPVVEPSLASESTLDDIPLCENRVSFEEFQKALLNNGALDYLQLLTPEMLETILEKYDRRPDLLLAASHHVEGEAALAYLEEFLESSPDSVVGLMREVQVLLDMDRFDEAAKTSIDKLRALDPTNALFSYYDAIWHLEHGDRNAALAAFREGNGKGAVEEYSRHHLGADETFYWEATGSETVARGLATFGSRMDALTHLRSLSNDFAEEAHALSERGSFDDAAQLHYELARLGRSVSNSGWSLVQTLAGTSMESRALQALSPLVAQLGQGERINDLDQQIAENQRRVAVLAQLQRTSTSPWQSAEPILAEYFDRITREGEVSALRWLLEQSAEGSEDR